MSLKLTGFGCAKATDGPTYTQVGGGDGQYCSPEQHLGNPYRHTTDLFTIGEVMFELAAGRRPFTKYAPGFNGDLDEADAVDDDINALLSEGKPGRLIVRPQHDEISQKLKDLIYWMLTKTGDCKVAMSDTTKAKEIRAHLI